MRRVACLWEVTYEMVEAEVKRFWQFCKWVLSTCAAAPLWVNFDETPVWFGQYAMRTSLVQSPGSSAAPVAVRGKGKLARKRITVGLSISSDAAFAKRLPIFVVGRNPRGRRRPNSAAWRDVSVPGRLALRFQQRAWMDGELVMDCLACLVAAWAEHGPPSRMPCMIVDG